MVLISTKEYSVEQELPKQAFYYKNVVIACLELIVLALERSFLFRPH